MSDDNKPSINLLASSTLTANIQCKLPGDGADVWRPFPFKATFKVLSEGEREALDDQDLTIGDYLREVLVSVDGIPAAVDPATGEEVSPKEVAIRNPFTQGSLWGEYIGLFAQNANEAVARHTSLQGKNSKRSRKR
ncbi:MAG TPA: hypothetical protein VFN09_11460 [Rhodanobacteraceae bacterium]|nr:hypothetical protein [Rhodanobacteraceae bacterium]